MPQFLGNTLTNHTASMAAYRQPCFAIWSSNSSQGGFSVIDHNLYTMSRFSHHNSSPGGGAGMSSTGSPEMFDTYATNSAHDTSATPTSSSSYWAHGCAAVGYLGNVAMNIGDGYAGEMQGNTAASNYRGQAFRDVGTIVNEPRQDYAIWLTTDRFRIGPRSANWFASLNSGRGTSTNVLTLTPKQSGYASTAYGNVSYNAKTNQMCVIERDGSYGARPTVYSNVPRLSTYAENFYQDMATQTAARNATIGSNLYTFFSTAANYTTTYAAASGKPTNGTTEDNYRSIPVMCDNGKIVMFQMIPSGGNYAWVHRWNADGTAAGSIFSQSYTTQYGMDSGNQFGARFQVSSDGRYVLAYCSSYHYNTGYQAALIRVSDGKVVYDYNNDSTYGYQFVPVGKSDFYMGVDVNADGGAGLYCQYIHADHIMHTFADGSRADFARSRLTQLHSSNFYSTDYPVMIPMMYDTKLFYDL